MVEPENSTGVREGKETPGAESKTTAAGKRLPKPELIKKMEGLLKSPITRAKRIVLS